MFWVAFKGYNNGKAISLGWLEQVEAEAYGMHGYPTEAQAEAKPNTVPAIAKAQVNAWIFNAQGSVTTHVKNKVTSTVANAAKSVLGSGWSLVFGNTTGLLGRIIKVGLGGILIIAGITRISGVKKDIIAVAGTAVKGAIP